MRKRLFILFFVFLQIMALKAQEYVHQVFVLNEGYFDYTLNQLVVPPTIGVYNPSTQSYISVDTLYSARFASDLVVHGDYFYVSADNMLYKYDKNTYSLLETQQVDGVRNIVVWNNKIIVSRGDYDNVTFMPILFDSYLQIYNASDLSFYTDIDTIIGPRWATQNLIVYNDKLYVAINNAYEWGNEKGIIGVLDLNTFSYINEIDLGLNGINPDNMMKIGDHIYTINNKDWSGHSISQLSLLTNSVSTFDLSGTPTGCGTSCLRDGKINYQISGDSILNEWDISLLPSSGTPLSINQNFYDLSYDAVNNLLYASITDYATYGAINIYNDNDVLVDSFSCGVSPGNIVFDIRSVPTTIYPLYLDHSDIFSDQYYDVSGRIISDNYFIKGAPYIRGGKLFLDVR